MHFPHQTEIIVFDFDGTLLDSMTGFGDIAADVISRLFGRDVSWARDQYRQTSGLPFPFQLEKIFPGDLRNRQAVSEFDRIKMDTYPHRPFYPDFESTLTALKAEGYLLAISSNNDHRLLEWRLKEKSSYFDFVLGFTEGFLKGKAHFDWIKNQTGLQNSQILFIGDSLHDAEMAQENAIPFVAKLGTFSENDFARQGIAQKTIHHLSELTKILEHAKKPHANRHHGGWLGSEA